MRALSALLKQEALLVTRNAFFIIMALVLAMLVAAFYLVPEEISIEPPRVYLDETPGGRVRQLLESAGEWEGRFVDSVDSLEAQVRASRQTIGVRFLGSKEEPGRIELYANGNPGSSTRNLIESSMRALLRTAYGDAPDPAPTIERLGPERASLSNREVLVPILLTFEVIVLGFMFVAVMIFQDRADGAIAAFRVSPAGPGLFVASKLSLWVIMSLLYAIVFVSFTIGFGLSISQWVTLLALVALAATFMTGLGLLVSLYFHSISDWFLPGITILVVLMLPQISFGAPAFSPAWLRFIPTTPVLFAFRDALYGSSEGGSMLSTAALLAAFAAAAVGAAYAGVRFKLLRETRS